MAQISERIGPATHNVAEYRALIAGLTLARRHGQSSAGLPVGGLSTVMTVGLEALADHVPSRSGRIVRGLCDHRRSSTIGTHDDRTGLGDP